jgi:signal transduction histidine kinase
MLMRCVKGILPALFLLMACVAALAQEQIPGAGPLGVWQQSQQMQRDYIELLKKQAAADPNNLSLQLNLGRAYHWLALSHEEDALIEGEKTFKQILAREPDNAVALAYAGSLLGLKIGYRLIPEDQIVPTANQAGAALDRAVSLAPDSIEVRMARGYESFYTPSIAGRDALAIEDFTRVIELFKQIPVAEARRAEVLLVLGDAYRKMGEMDRARAQWERARALTPASSLALVAESRLRQFENQEETTAVDFKRPAALAGFLIGVLIYTALAALVTRDLTGRRRRGTAEALVVALIALGWNGLNLAVAVAAALNSTPPLRVWRLADWQQDYFNLLLALAPIPLGLVIVYRFYEAQRKHAIAEEKLRKLLTQAELRALRAQIDPHFFFNALNSVVALIHRDPAAAEELIEDLADLFRHSFKPSRDFIALGEELSLVETYLKVEKVRLGDKLRFNKVVTPEALTVRIPALTVQPLVENAVKHGIGNLAEGGQITLSAAVKDGHLNIAIADTGAGLPSAPLPQLFTRGVGLSNINERLSALYGAQSRLRIDSHPGQGATVSFAIPLMIL